MNIIFLDIDGVLNTERFVKIQVKNNECNYYEAQFNFDPICMKNLKELINDYCCKVVITSTWRLDYPNDKYWIELIGNFKKYGIDNSIIGVTTRKYDIRGKQIQEWLKQHKEVNNYVIIDDDSDMGELINKLAKCDSKTGLTNEVKNKCIELLGGN